MLFNSVQFLLFFPPVTAIYFLLPQKFRWIHLLIASSIFYMVFIPIYIFILFFTIVIDYVAGITIENSTGGKRKFFLLISLIANIGVLSIFKYYNFFIENLNNLLHALNLESYNVPFLSIVLPIGLSFHTFQAMSYTIEVYRKKQKAERHLGLYALYVMYYPQLVAGPIERPQHILPQLKKNHDFNYEDAVNGLKLMAWGMFKKVVIADRLSLLVNHLYQNPYQFEGMTIVLGMIFFSFQIYCDFSGYSDIAIGASQVMGIKLMENFRQPYFSKSISEFWQRWHISLSTWFRDYLYISLGGNRVGTGRRYCNLLIVFLISGLWHGASWTFVIWGAMHGCLLILGHMTKSIQKRFRINGPSTALNDLLAISLTFSLVTVTWVFFRADTFNQALYLMTHFYKNLFSLESFSEQLLQLGISKIYLTICIVLITFLIIIEQFQTKINIFQWVNTRSILLRWSIYFGIIYSIVFLGVWGEQQFIYFQF